MPSSHPHSPEAARGALAAASCYLLWGLFPIYWKHLGSIDALQLIAHRNLWSLVFVVGVMLAHQGWSELRDAITDPTALKWHGASGALLTVNWLVYVWGVNHGHVIETSLGYFLVPLVNVAVGRFALHERLRPAQWLAIACAGAGVMLLVWRVGQVPWIALSLACTWGSYGLLRKKSPLGPLVGLGLETLLIAPLALALIVARQLAGAGALGHATVGEHALLLASGVVTAVPLVMFAYGARRLRMTTLGLLQYIAPSVQFAIGVWIYREPFSPEKAAAFAFIWCGLALYTADNLWAQRRLIRV